MIINISVIVASFISYEKRIIDGLPPEEIRMAVNYEYKANPEKQLPLLLWLPKQIDDTVQPTYSIFVVYDVVMCIMCTAIGKLSSRNIGLRDPEVPRPLYSLH